MTYQNDDLTEDQAKRLWARAAELQEHARTQAQRLAEESAASPPARSGDELTVSLDVAREAAVESGIDARYVDQALRQVRLERELDTRSSAAGWARALRTSERAVSERITVAGPPSAATSPLASVAESAPFQLDLLDVVELDNGASAYVYDVRGEGEPGSFRYQVRDFSDITRVAAMVAPSADGGTEIEVYCTLDNSVRVHGIALRILQAVGGALGVGLGVAVAALLSRITGLEPGTATAVLQTVLGVTFGIGTAALTGRTFRSIYRRGLTNVRDSFRKLLMAVRMRIE